MVPSAFWAWEGGRRKGLLSPVVDTTGLPSLSGLSWSGVHCFHFRSVWPEKNPNPQSQSPSFSGALPHWVSAYVTRCCWSGRRPASRPLNERPLAFSAGCEIAYDLYPGRQTAESPPCKHSCSSKVVLLWVRFIYQQRGSGGRTGWVDKSTALLLSCLPQQEYFVIFPRFSGKDLWWERGRGWECVPAALGKLQSPSASSSSKLSSSRTASERVLVWHHTRLGLRRRIVKSIPQ